MKTSYILDAFLFLKNGKMHLNKIMNFFIFFIGKENKKIEMKKKIYYLTHPLFLRKHRFHVVVVVF